MIIITDADKQLLIDLATGTTGAYKYKDTQHFEITSVFSCEYHNSFVHPDIGLMNTYMMVRVLVTEKERKIFDIQLVECSVNVLDKFPDKAIHENWHVKNIIPIIALLKNYGLEFDNTQRFLTK